MTVLLPALAFMTVFAGVLVLSRRSQRTLLQLGRHEIASGVTGSIAIKRERTPILGGGRNFGLTGQLAARVTRRDAQRSAAKLLREAGSPMPLATYLAVRAVCAFIVAPLFVLYMWGTMGLTPMGIITLAVGAFSIPQLPTLRIKRMARKRAKAVETALPDALDLLVVCAEGGLSLDAATQQVAQRTDGLLATEFRRVLNEIASGMPRRDALASLGERTQSESLKIFCSTIIQSDRMGMSIASTLRTLAATMRTRRRQAAETQARKAPIKMLPFLVFFMIPSLFIVILAPAARSIMTFFGDAT